MYKQKQLGCFCDKRKQKCLRHQKLSRKNKQIQQTYISNPRLLTKSLAYGLIQKQKLQALKKKNSGNQMMLKPGARYRRNARTQCSGLEQEYLLQLRNIKSEIKSLNKGISEKRTPHYCLPIQINPTNNYDQEGPIKDKSTNKKQKMLSYRNDKRHISSLANHSYQQDLVQLQDEVRNLKRQVRADSTVQKTYQFPSINRYKPYLKSTRSSFVKNNSFNRKLNFIGYSDRNHKTNMDTQVSQRNEAGQSGLRKVKKVVNAICFTIYLKQFSYQMRLKRQGFFKQNLKQSIYNQMSALKTAFIKSTQRLLKTLPLAQAQTLIVTEDDHQKQRQLKVSQTRKYLNRFLDIIAQTQFNTNIMKNLAQTCYFVCRHGGAGAVSSYFTSQELEIMCISNNSLRIRAQKNLQTSQIIAFVWIKIIIFNILLRTESIEELKLQNNIIWNSNLYLIGCLIYQMSRGIQTQLIEKVPRNYVIGNWKHVNILNQKNSLIKSSINPCKSMTINRSAVQKMIKTQNRPNQPIQGTISKGFLSLIYQIQSWQVQQRKIHNYSNLIHRQICKYHVKIKEGLA